MIVVLLVSLNNRFTKLEPMKPAAPVTKIVFPSRLIFSIIHLFSMHYPSILLIHAPGTYAVAYLPTPCNSTNTLF